MQRLRYMALQDSLPDQEANELCSLGIDLLDCNNESLPGFCSNDRNFLAWNRAFDHFVNEHSKESHFSFMLFELSFSLNITQPLNAHDSHIWLIVETQIFGIHMS